MTHALIILGIVWLATAGCMFGLGFEACAWLAERQWTRPVTYWPTIEAYRATTPFQGAADAGQFEIPRAGQIDRMAMLDDALAISERQMTAAEAHREAEQIWLEVQGNPDLWPYLP